MDQFYNRTRTPDKPGKYWVVAMVTVTENGKKKKQPQDDGYSIWNGERWDREDWDNWYGSAKPEREGVR